MIAAETENVKMRATDNGGLCALCCHALERHHTPMFQSVNRPMPFWTGVVAGISKAHRVFLHASGTMGGWVRPARSQQRQGISIVNVLVQAYPNGADAGKCVVPVPVDCLAARSPSKSSEGLV